MSRKGSAHEPSAPLAGYSARIKNLYIELNEYSYFHSPSEIDDVDPRFTGRRNVIERLKNLFTDHQTPSGAYLVTGYRGAGKSSLVSRALSEINLPARRRRRASRYLRLTAPLVPAALLGGLFTHPLFLAFLGVSVGLLLLALLLRDPNRPDLLTGRGRVFWREWGSCVARLLYLSEEREPRRRARILAQDALVLLLVLLAGGLTIAHSAVEGFWFRVLTYLFWLALYLGANMIAVVARNLVEDWVEPDVRPPLLDVDAQRSRRERRWRRLTAPWRAVLQVKDRIKDRLRYGNRVYIKVNLSQDDIEEIDILRLIAKNVYIKYREFVKGWRTDLHWKLLRIVVLILVVTVIYNLDFVHALNRGFTHDSHMPCYLPSQGSFLLNGGYASYRTTAESMLERRFYADALREELEAQSEPWPSEGPQRPAFDHDFSNVSNDLSKRIQHGAMNAMTYLDTFIQLSYIAAASAAKNLLSSVEPSSWGLVSKVEALTLRGVFDSELVRDGPIVPRGVDYLFLFYVLVIGLLIQLVGRWPRAGLVSHKQILKRLEELDEMIDTQVTREKGGLPVSGALVAFSFGKRKSRTYTALNARDIEKHLLEILKMIESIPRLTVRPEFIFIFDELDKIQHHLNFTLLEKEQELDEYQGREFTSVEAERARQHRILSLVSNLKHFLTTAPAKFVFIAGREMFDAALADVSDRHFFMGSVFNEVLHVPSFHSDDSDDRLPDITSLTEQYVCRFLVPRRLWHRGICLRTYHEYLLSDLLPDAADDSLREKVIYELHNFITYISYRSNGAPKKITKAIERYLVRLGPDNVEHPDSESEVVGRSSNRFYLHFTYYDQYTFDLMTYLGSPLIFALNRAIKDYGDKILVSSSFLLDHIYKFHGHGFSWRNLELLPEIVDINRAPQLRELIAHIMDFLAKSAITEVASGLYDFKFNRRIVEEISFLSKISEHESAAFNFTLDESLAIKRHFNQKLHRLLETYDDYPNQVEGQFINSVSFVRMILGDLHFYDGELDTAIVEYMEAVQSLRDADTRDLRLDTLVLMVRNFLKLGLTFERKKSFDSALVTYGRVSALVAEMGDRSHAARRLHKVRCAEPTPAGRRRFEQVIFEGSRLIFQPMYARLQVAEKATLGGISRTDIDNVVKDFKGIIRPRRERERYLLASEFNNKVADILYFKNGPAEKEEDRYCGTKGALCAENTGLGALTEEGRSLPCVACGFYNRALDGLCRGYLGIEEPGGPKTVVEILKRFEGGDPPKVGRMSSLLELARTLSHLGDTYLSCNAARTIDRPFLTELLRLLPKPGEKAQPRSAQLDAIYEQIEGGLNKLEEALVYYVLAALIYRWSASSQACVVELTKVLWVIREHIAIHKNRQLVDHELLELIGTLLVRTAIEESYRSHEGTHRLEIEKIKEILELPDRERPFVNSVNLGRLSINSSITEILVVYDEICLTIAPKDRLHEIDSRCSPHSMFHSVFSRIHALRLRAGINFHNLRALGLGGATNGREAAETLDYFVKKEEILRRRSAARKMSKLLDEVYDGDVSEMFPGFEDQIDLRSILEFLITDSIYCMHEIIRFMAIYGNSYMASHSMRAAAHRSMARWCDYYYAYLRVQHSAGTEAARDRVRLLEKRLQNLIGQGDMVDLSPSYHAEMALLHYRAARETHSEGRAYTELMEKMYYLNDDFADQLEHFCAGLERLRINAGNVDEEIEKLKGRLQPTTIYALDRYRTAGRVVEADARRR